MFRLRFVEAFLNRSRRATGSVLVLIVDKRARHHVILGIPQPCCREENAAVTRIITISEIASGLHARFALLDAQAPAHAEMLWRLARRGTSHDAIHAMWTGPEISCPIMASSFPPDAPSSFPAQNATSFPESGEIATVLGPSGRWKDAPAEDFFDIGIFYDRGARLLMPMGWIMASVAACVLPEDFDHLQRSCRLIRHAGACRLTFGTGPETRD